MTTDYSEVLVPWTRRGNDPADGAFITSDDALESLTKLREFLRDADWLLMQQVAAAVQSQFPQGTLPPQMNFRGVIPSQASAPASVPNPQPGDFVVTNDLGRAVGFTPQGQWVDLGRLFVTTGAGGAMTPAVKLVPDVGPQDLNKVLSSGATGVPQWMPLVDNEAPPGGTAGQVLAKATATDRDVVWRDESRELPTVGPGNNGQVLTVGAGGDLRWEDPPAPAASTTFRGSVPNQAALPTNANVGDVYVTQDNGHLHVAVAAGPPTVYTDMGPLVGNTLPAIGANGQVLTVVGGTVTWQTPVDRVVPAGGVPGQTIRKTGPADQQAGWVDMPMGLPAGGTAGQVLAKVDATAGRAQWTDPTDALPPTAGHNAGDMLVVDDPARGTALWVEPPTFVPDGGAQGQLLGKLTAADGDVGWVAALPAATQFRGAVADAVALATIANPQPGDVAVTISDGHLHIYHATPAPGWNDVGPAATNVNIAQWRTGNQAPTAALGDDGDWFALGDGHIYVKVNGQWHTVYTPVIDVEWVRQTNRDPVPADIAGAITPGKSVWINRTTRHVFFAQTGAWLDLGRLLPDLGTAGQVLTVNAGATAPEWADVPKELPPYAVTNHDQSLHVQQDGTLAWKLPFPVVVKQTQPTAADYGDTTIPDNAVWIRRAP